MSYNELMGATPLTEAELQARVQAIVEREWPAWQRERALRLGDFSPELSQLNAFFSALNVEVEAARAHHAALWAASEAAAAITAEADTDPDSDPEEPAP